MKRKIASILIIIIVIMFFSNSILVSASSNIFSQDESLTEIMNGVELDNFNKIQEEGTTSTNGDTRQENVSIDMQNQQASMPFLLKLLCRLLLAIPQILNATMSQITSDGKEIFTIESLLTNEYDLFNIKYLIDSSGMSGDVEGVLGPIGNNTAGWFVGVRNIAMVGSVITLIYVAIRLAIATVAKDKSELKRMLLSWVEALVILLTLQFFIVFIIYASDFVVETFKNTIEKTTGSTKTVEEQIMTNINKNLDKAYQSRTTIFYSVLYIMFTYYEVKFFAIYLIRVLRIAFYIVIAPLVCVTYPIDKIGDGRAQGFNNWLIEFSITSFMQPVHLLIYLVMVYSMGEIFTRNPILGVIFLASLSHAEKTFKGVLHVKPKLQSGVSDINLNDFVKLR